MNPSLSTVIPAKPEGRRAGTQPEAFHPARLGPGSLRVRDDVDKEHACGLALTSKAQAQRLLAKAST